jgi:hypothetical protein
MEKVSQTRPCILLVFLGVTLVLVAWSLDLNTKVNWYGVLSPLYLMGIVLFSISLWAFVSKTRCQNNEPQILQQEEEQDKRPKIEKYNQKEEEGGVGSMDIVCVDVRLEWETLIMYFLIGLFFIIQPLLIAHASQKREEIHWFLVLGPTMVTLFAFAIYFLIKLFKQCESSSSVRDNESVTFGDEEIKYDLDEEEEENNFVKTPEREMENTLDTQAALELMETQKKSLDYIVTSICFTLAFMQVIFIAFAIEKKIDPQNWYLVLVPLWFSFFISFGYMMIYLANYLKDIPSYASTFRNVFTAGFTWLILLSTSVLLCIKIGGQGNYNWQVVFIPLYVWFSGVFLNFCFYTFCYVSSPSS